MNQIRERRKFPRLACNGKLPGPLILSSTKETIQCRSLDVSRFGMGIWTTVDIPLGDGFILQAPGDLEIEFSAVVKQNDNGQPRGFRIGLVTSDETLNIDDLFSSHNCLEEVKAKTSSKDLPDRAPRFRPNVPLHIEASTFGTQARYPLVCENISRSGLLVVASPGFQTPFRLHTILELMIDTKCDWVKEPFASAGKIIRFAQAVDEDGNPMTLLGIAMVDFDETQNLSWNRLIDAVEKSVAAAD